MKFVKIEDITHIVIDVSNITFGSGSGFYEITSSFYFPPVVKYGQWKYIPISESFEENYYYETHSFIINGNILPGAGGGSIGTSGSPFSSLHSNEVYIGSSSLYVNGTRLVESSASAMIIHTDPDQDLILESSGTGDIQNIARNEFNIFADGGIEGNVTNILANKHINFLNQSYAGNITFTAQGNNAEIQFFANEEISLDALDTISITAPEIEFDALDTISITAPEIEFNGIVSGITNADTASYLSGLIESASYCETASYLQGLIESSSYSVYSETASLLLGSVESSSYAETASYFDGFVESASYSENAVLYSSSFENRISKSESDIIQLQEDSSSFSTLISINESYIQSLISDSGSFSYRLTNIESDSASFENRISINENGISYLIDDSASFDERILNIESNETISYALTASYLEGSIESASYSQNAEDYSSSLQLRISTNEDDINNLQLDSGSFGIRITNNESNIQNNSSSFEGRVTTLENKETSSYAITSSYSDLALTASYAVNTDVSVLTQSLAFDGYDDTGGQTISTTATTININNERTNTDSNIFNLSGNSIGVGQDGVFVIMYKSSLDDPNTTRSSHATWLELDGNEISGSRVYSYHRTTAAGEDSIAGQVISNITSGSRISLGSQRIAGTDNITLAGSSISIFGISGIKGDKGDQGSQGTSLWTGSIDYINRESDVQITGSLYVDGTGSFGYTNITNVSSASYSDYAQTASFLEGTIESASYALTASYLEGNIESSSYSETSSFSQTTVYGSYSQYSSSDTETTTTSTTFVEKLKITTPILPVGEYRISWYYETQASSVNADNMETQVQIDDTNVIAYTQQRPYASTNPVTWHPTYEGRSGFYIINNAVESSHSIDIDYRAVQGTAYIRRARLEIWRTN